jgi:hypothetical protein
MILTNLYDCWELFWPLDATWGDLRSAANESSSYRVSGVEITDTQTEPPRSAHESEGACGTTRKRAVSSGRLAARELKLKEPSGSCAPPHSVTILLAGDRNV